MADTLNMEITRSFDDLIPYKFSYDSENKEIIISYDSYYDIVNEKFIEERCAIIISNWKSAKSRNCASSSLRYGDLEENLGIFSLILGVVYENNILHLAVSTIDNRDISLEFINPNIFFEDIV